MKKVLAIVLVFIFSFSFMVNTFAATTYRGESFYFESDLEFVDTMLDENGERMPDYLYEEDIGSGKPADFYTYFFEYTDPEGGQISLNIEEYFRYYDCDGPEDYYSVLEDKAAEWETEITTYNGCPAVVIDEDEEHFGCYVCNDEYLYYIEAYAFDEVDSDTLSDVLETAKSIKFTEKYTGSSGNNAKPGNAQNNDDDGAQKPDKEFNDKASFESTDSDEFSMDSTTIIIVAIIAAATIICVVIIVTRKKK